MYAMASYFLCDAVMYCMECSSTSAVRHSAVSASAPAAIISPWMSWSASGATLRHSDTLWHPVTPRDTLHFHQLFADVVPPWYHVSFRASPKSTEISPAALVDHGVKSNKLGQVVWTIWATPAIQTRSHQSQQTQDRDCTVLLCWCWTTILRVNVSLKRTRMEWNWDSALRHLKARKVSTCSALADSKHILGKHANNSNNTRKSENLRRPEMKSYYGGIFISELFITNFLGEAEESASLSTWSSLRGWILRGRGKSYLRAHPGALQSLKHRSSRVKPTLLNKSSNSIHLVDLAKSPSRWPPPQKRANQMFLARVLCNYTSACLVPGLG